MRIASDGKRSLSQRVFASIVIACAIVAVVVTAVASALYQSAFLADEHEQLAGECRTVVSLLDRTGDDVAVLGELDFSGIRVTLVEPDGTVSYDSLADALTLPNHADRPEVAAALSTGSGSAERASATSGYVSLYETARLASGSVVRLSVDRASVATFLVQDVVMLAAIAAVVVGVSWLVSRRLARRFVRPILQIDPSGGDATAPYEELDPLVGRLNEQHAELVGRMAQIQDADDMRREFTANVTHELKTPIASISGASELMRDGLVRAEDVRDFAGRIYDDAQRLSALVSDILMLSKLDESERVGDREIFGLAETVDLRTVATDVAGRLAPRARRAQVSVSVEGVSSLVTGNARLLDELVENLVENAIRYNRPGGQVFVWVVPQDGRPCVRVADTGIGIAGEAQGKVFERFYRVDKGRSRQTGGTGLGLAIVKHAAAYHDAQIRLESTPGEGTSVTVTFPA